MKRQHIGIDLDGVLLRYRGWRGPRHFDPPVPGAVEWIEELLERGHRVTVFTSRTNLKQVQRKLVEMGFPRLRVTNVKDPTFSVIIDDRAMYFEPSMFKEIEAVEGLVPWWVG